MNIKRTKKPEARFDMKYVSTLGIKTYGDSNLYPQTLRDIVDSSPTGRTCIERRATYIEGNGLASQILADTVCNLAGHTVDDVHHLCAEDIAYYDGFALHVNYNLQGEVVSLAHIPFEDCRLKEEDADGIISHIIVHPDWRGRLTRNGRAVKVTSDEVRRFPIFNPDPEVVQQQILTAGGIEFYCGQILYVSRAGRNAYPIPLVDVVLTDMSTDEGLSNVNNRNVRSNFLTAGMLVTKRGQSGDDSDNGFTQEFERLQGDMNALKMMQVEVETDEDIPEFVPFKTTNYDKEFTATTSSVIENIYAALNQEMFARLRKGSIGFSGDLANDVKREYCEQVTKQQRMLQRAYRQVFEHWAPNTVPYNSVADVAIEPLFKSVSNNEEASN